MKKLLTIICVITLALIAPQMALASEVGEELSHSCSFCGLCPEPLGICIFFYVIALLVGLFIFIFFRKSTKKCPLCKEKCDPKAEMCPKCGYDFESGLQSTLNIRVADNPELVELQKDREKEFEDTIIPVRQEGTESDILDKSIDIIDDIKVEEPLFTPKLKDTETTTIDNEVINDVPVEPKTPEIVKPIIIEQPVQEDEPVKEQVKVEKEEPTPPPPPVVENKVCSKCGAQFPTGARFCGKCGNPL